MKTFSLDFNGSTGSQLLIITNTVGEVFVIQEELVKVQHLISRTKGSYVYVAIVN